MKHFMCTHTFSSEDAWARSSNPDTVLTDRQFFELLNKDKARVLQHWRGSEDFFFCHWEADSKQAILDWLDELGVNDFISTELHEQWRFTSFYNQSDDLRDYKED